MDIQQVRKEATPRPWVSHNAQEGALVDQSIGKRRYIELAIEEDTGNGTYRKTIVAWLPLDPDSTLVPLEQAQANAALIMDSVHRIEAVEQERDAARGQVLVVRSLKESFQHMVGEERAARKALEDYTRELVKWAEALHVSKNSVMNLDLLVKLRALLDRKKEVGL